MPLLAFIAATSIACLNPAHRDGQSIRCGEKAPVMQLQGITAPPIAANCNNFNCADDPGITSRDHLADLTRGQSLVCTITKTGKTRTARCDMSGVDLSCAMVADGMATRSGPLPCPASQEKAREAAEIARNADNFLNLPPLWRWVPLFLILINIIGYGAFALDQSRERRGLSRIAPAHILALTFFGGGIGGLAAMFRLEHLQDEQPFTSQFAILLGLQIGALFGLLLF